MSTGHIPTYDNCKFIQSNDFGDCGGLVLYHLQFNLVMGVFVTKEVILTQHKEQEARRKKISGYKQELNEKENATPGGFAD